MKILLLFLLINFSESLGLFSHEAALKALENLHYNKIYHSSFSSLDCIGNLTSKTPNSNFEDLFSGTFNITKEFWHRSPHPNRIRFFVPAISTYFEAEKDENEQVFKISLERQICLPMKIANIMHQQFRNLQNSQDFAKILHFPFKYGQCLYPGFDDMSLPRLQEKFSERLDRKGSWVMSAKYEEGTGYKKIVYFAKGLDGRTTKFVLEILDEPGFVFSLEHTYCVR